MSVPFFFYLSIFAEDVNDTIMKKLYVSIIISFIAFSAISQNLFLGAEGQKFYEEFLMRKAVKGEAESYEGSPYLSEEFTEATVTSSENQVFEKVPVRYNVYYDLFEVQLENEVYNLKRGGIVSRVNLEGHSFIYSKYNYQSTDREGYLELILEGKYTLYKQLLVVFKEAEPAQPYQDPKPAKFQGRDPLFYIAFGDNDPVFIKNMKNLLGIAGDNEKALKDFIKDNRLRVRNEEDMIKAVEFLSEIK